MLQEALRDVVTALVTTSRSPLAVPTRVGPTSRAAGDPSNSIRSKQVVKGDRTNGLNTPTDADTKAKGIIILRKLGDRLRSGGRGGAGRRAGVAT
ncbi:hypothetical protein EVAR_55390_1 [Eumeta japonica]|uniref:Uncharacterized protein n=1 Tax=Eumeta variegata TaxID=151549 RepID=A0A4C1YNA1_EUMVA|nr:hypothetical protein EVAR_55390_1 [Eumeta japonica]